MVAALPSRKSAARFPRAHGLFLVAKDEEGGATEVRDGAAGASVERATCTGAAGEAIEPTRDAEETEFLCECGRDGCCARLSMSLAEYERVRAVPTRFAVAPGHEWPGFERVLETTPRFSVVQTATEEKPRRSDRGRRGPPSLLH